MNGHGARRTQQTHFYFILSFRYSNEYSQSGNQCVLIMFAEQPVQERRLTRIQEARPTVPAPVRPPVENHVYMEPAVNQL